MYYGSNIFASYLRRFQGETVQSSIAGREGMDENEWEIRQKGTDKDIGETTYNCRLTLIYEFITADAHTQK